MQELKLAFRQLRTRRAFTAVAIFTLALGIGANTAIYSVVNSLLLNPVPGPEPDRLMQIAERRYDNYRQPGFWGVSPRVLKALRAKQDLYSAFVWWISLGLEKKTDGFLGELWGAMVSPNFFSLWNIQPILGRTFAADETTPLDAQGKPSADSVIVISHSVWQSQFAGSPGTIGRTMELNGRHFTVIGIMPAHFQFPEGANSNFWLPIDSRLTPDWNAAANYRVLVRLKPNTTPPQVQASLDATTQLLGKDYSPNQSYFDEWRRKQAWGLWLRPLRSEFSEGRGYGQGTSLTVGLQRTLFGLLGGIGFVLLIVCLNIANLTLARAEHRQEEMALRAALGASRGRLLRQLLTESALLAVLGGVCGLAVSHWGVQLLASLIPATIPRLRALEIDAHALGYTLVVSLATVLLFGLVPALRSSRTPLGTGLKQAAPHTTASSGRRRYRSLLIVTEVALAVILLTGAGLMIESVIRSLRVNPGFDPNNLLRIYVELKSAAPSLVEERLLALPGVQGVGVGKQANFLMLQFKIDGREDPVNLRGGLCGIEGSDLFRAMRTPLLAGRYFNKGDLGEKAPSVIINESMARTCWPSGNAVGQKFRYPSRQGDEVHEVVGVVSDSRIYSYDQRIDPTFYRPLDSTVRGGWWHFVVRAETDPQSLIPSVRQALKDIEPAMRSPTISVIHQTLYEATRIQRTYTLFLLGFAGLGLLLSAVGVYGVLAGSVARRTREIGVRLALGADRHQVQALVLREGMRLITLGAALGLIGAFWLTQVLRSQLFGIQFLEPRVFLGVISLLLVVAGLACWLPARRAAMIDPAVVLRNE